MILISVSFLWWLMIISTFYMLIGHLDNLVWEAVNRFLTVRTIFWTGISDSDAGRDWGQEEKGTTEDEMAGWHHWLDGCECEWTPGVADGQGGLACCNSWSHKELDTTEWLNWTELKLYLVMINFFILCLLLYFFNIFIFAYKWDWPVIFPSHNLFVLFIKWIGALLLILYFGGHFDNVRVIYSLRVW